MISLEYITDELKNEMKMNIPDEQQFDTWIDILKPLKLHEDKLYLEIPKKDILFIFDQIRKPQLQKALDKVTEGENYNLKVDIIARDSDQYEKILTLGNNFEEDGQMRISQVTTHPKPQLDKANTFSNFVEGKSNQYALSISKAVADTVSRKEVSKAFNPLFIYSAPGLGKTHLMQAIAHQVIENRDDCYVMYLSSEKFTNEMIVAINTGRNEEFREKYRSVDILLIDDIQFLSKKDGTQLELFHTFNDLYTEGKQIVISSDRPPKEIKDLEERLISRFNYGIIADITKPDYETRVAILQKKLEYLGAYVDNTILSYIAENINTNIRDLEGTLSTAIAYAKSDNRNIVTMEDAIRSVETRALNRKKHVTIDDIQRQVAERYSIKLSDLKGKSRKKEIVNPRQIAMYLSRDILEDSLVTISHSFDRDHTTVMHAIDKIKEQMEIDELFKIEIESIRKEITE